MKIMIVIGTLSAEAELNETPTALKVAEALPLTASFSTWGDEIYFAIPVDAPLDDSAQEIVQAGDLGYWPTGRAFCIFFGPTPMSRGDEIIPASAVNIIGRVTADPSLFRAVMNERTVTLQKG